MFRQNEENPFQKAMTRRRVLKTALAAGITGAGLVFGFNGIREAWNADRAVSIGMGPSERPADDMSLSVPAIDRMAPADLQTATFALG